MSAAHGRLMMTNKPLTPLSQRVAVERYSAKQLNKGLTEVTVWFPVDTKQELYDFAALKRAEFELSKGASHDKEAE